jgi:phosphoribosylanthranilate isomerase
MRTQVKICGLRDARGLDAAVAAGADAIGLVLERGSRRAVPRSEARQLLARVPPGVRRVAVFVRPSAEELRAAVDLGFDAVQAAAPFAPPSDFGLGFVPAVADGPDLLARAAEARATARPPRCAILVDGPRGGGRGETADHDRVAALAWRVPLWLAGGLDPDRVAAAIHRVRPIGVDVSSGVESAPGIKDPARIAAFVAAVRSLEPRAPR